ncbi:methyltransferase type 11 [Catellatospora methionotrophica]|uniref:Methyltransferase type 11 n=1 Tax=Catellatospora methionotrophica TaxID=121620 RepID=A0A8J3PEH9_9ACTN|nr:class I SAM-dependent methyltransferase [Catellatospora methionotrophica]GIG14626.1 methyltransferase type 11 [Catellatospora methionotrophica]
MPTLPRQQPPSAPEPHLHRQVAESFGTDPERYDRARPRYPDALVERILSGSPGPDVLDVGCGTGIAARQFRAAGSRVLGVEPDARMAAFARGTGIAVDVATFEDWEPAGRQFDAVVAGMAWHWVDPVAGAAKAARVLRPRGRLALFWYVMQPPAEMGDALQEGFRRALPDSPFTMPAASASMLDGYQLMLTKAADGIRLAGGFGQAEQWRFDRTRTYTRSGWLDQLATSGALTRLPAGLLAQVLADVGKVIDTMGGTVTVPHTTLAVTATRAV